jgi:hypothetical protein
MKKLYALISILLFMPAISFGQGIAVKSFRLAETDLHWHGSHFIVLHIFDKPTNNQSYFYGKSHPETVLLKSLYNSFVISS